MNWSEHTFWGPQDYNFDNTGFECPYWDEKMCLKLSLKLHKYQYLILGTCIYQPPPRLLLASVNTGWEVMRSLWKLCRFTNLILGSDPRHPHTTVKHSPPPPGYIVYYVTSLESLAWGYESYLTSLPLLTGLTGSFWIPVLICLWTNWLNKRTLRFIEPAFAAKNNICLRSRPIPISLNVVSQSTLFKI